MGAGKGKTRRLSVKTTNKPAYPALDVSPFEERWVQLPKSNGNYKSYVSVEPRPKYLPSQGNDDYYAYYRDDSSYSPSSTIGPISGVTAGEAVRNLCEAVENKKKKFVAPTEVEIQATEENPKYWQDPESKDRNPYTKRTWPLRHKPAPEPTKNGDDLSIHFEEHSYSTGQDDFNEVDHNISIPGYSVGGTGWDVETTARYFGSKASGEKYLVVKKFSQGDTGSVEHGRQSYHGVFDNEEAAYAYAELLAAAERPDWFGGPSEFRVDAVLPMPKKSKKVMVAEPKWIVDGSF